MGGRFTVYPRVLGWLLAHRRSFDAVLDCQNGIPFFTPLVLPRRVPVLCVMHHVHTAQFGVHFPAWLAWAGRLLEGPAARLAYRRHACVAVSPSTVAAMRERLRWTGDIYLIPNGARLPAGPARRPPPARAPRPRPSLVWVGGWWRTSGPADPARGGAAAGPRRDYRRGGPRPGAAAAGRRDRGPRPGGSVRLHGFLPEAESRRCWPGRCCT